MRLRALAFAAIAATGACAAQRAEAQTQAPGGAAAGRQLKIGARVEGAYDSNVSHSNGDVASIRGLSKSDYSATPSLTVSLSRPVGRQTVFLQGNVGYAFYRRNTQLNSEHSALDGGVQTRFSTCSASVLGGYRASQTELTSVDLASVKDVQRTTNEGVSIQCARPTGIGASLFAQRTQARNSESTRQTADSNTESITSSLLYGRPSLGVFSVGYSYTQTDYPNAVIPGRAGGTGFFTESYQVGYQRRVTSRLQVSATGALTHLKRDFAPPGVKQSFTSGTYMADLTYGLGPRIQIQATASRAFVPSQQVGKAYDKSTNANLSVNYRASPRLTFSAGASLQETNSNRDTTFPAGLFVTDSKNTSLFAAATYAPTPRWSLSLNVRHDDRTADLPQFNYTATRIGLTAQANLK